MNSKRTFAEALERALHRTKAGKLIVVANAGVGLTALVGGPALQGCGSEGSSQENTVPSENPDDGILIGADGKGDWAQDEGKRDTKMVAYTGESWREDKNCEPRAGCMSTDVFLKLRVQPVQNVNLDKKRVGVVYHEPGRTGQTTVLGEFYSTLQDGTEEWHVRVSLKKWEHAGAFMFTAWYQDGAGNTYYDDNEGEYHAAAWQGTWSIIHNSHGASPILNDGGLTGSLIMELLDLDYDKDVRLVWTLDSWKTVNEYKIGSEHVNNWHWLKNTYNGMQLWEITLDYKGSFDKFEYAVVYRHGGKNGSKVYEFWDNNGGYNYQVSKNQPGARF
ncbi:MAG: hypothetical protein HY898_21220 [Deltaproteobacteria bacterium]|nr:hypothetical protein [Deltaproteobacteria bacterium]